MRKIQNDILDNIKAEFEQYGYDTLFATEDDTQILKVLVDRLGSDESGNVILEMYFVNEEGMDKLQDVSFLQIFATYDCNVNSEMYSETAKALCELNFITALGAFALYEEQMQLFYKYTYVLNGTDPDILTGNINVVLNWIMGMLEDTYDKICELIG